ncbi:MAG: S-methyl-5-thioribose-1-phosphate isomerase [Sedimentisphaerales bacterium]|nr:S-methyl-5-thioribose-1-phosphate isomerase [Sedimentisphaerales bacterium]
MIKTLEWIGGIDGYLELIDQRRLPTEVVMLKCRTVEQLYHAIKTLTVRGAPAIGVAAGFGLSLAMQQPEPKMTLPQALDQLKSSRDYLASSRPTAVNLFYALDRVVHHAQNFVAGNPSATLTQLRAAILDEAQAIYNEDVKMCQEIGKNGESLIKDGGGILTHCNAGALATAGQGTALSPMFEAHKNGKKFTVYVDETRPLLQGARLTAWECMQAGLDAVLLCDNAAASLMQQGTVAAVFTGADRIAANGDTANKIGTYGLSVLAKAHNIPFYIVAPSSTFDLTIKSGSEIPIEQRSADEVTMLGGTIIAPADIKVYNPAFDVTPATHITAIITEKGVIENITIETIMTHLRSK